MTTRDHLRPKPHGPESTGVGGSWNLQNHWISPSLQEKNKFFAIIVYSILCHQHISSPTSVTNIDVTRYFQRTTVISFGIFGIASAICLLIFVGTLSDSMVVKEIRQLVKNPEFKDPYGLDLDDILETINILTAFGLTILLASIFGILGMFIFDHLLMILYSYWQYVT